MQPNLDKLNFYSGVNYMKRSDKSGQSTINAADLVIQHDLGYAPSFAYYAELDGDGFIWYGGERVWSGTDSTAGGGTAPPSIASWITENSLTLKPSFFTADRAAYWLIYLDYGA